MAYFPLVRVLRRDGVEAAAARARRVQAPSAGECDAAMARRLGRMTEQVLRLLPTDTRCLIRSLVVLRLVHRRGGAGRLVIGATSPSSFKAHAWVEVGGSPVMDTGGAGFHRLLEV